MLVKDIFMELRARLRSCNVYITTGIDLNKNCNLKVSIQSNCIILNYYSSDDEDVRRSDSLSSIESLSDCYSDEDQCDDEVTSIIPIDEFCHIIPNSMSCLKIDKNTISFRILTEPKNGGCFYKELLSNSDANSAMKSDKLKLNLKVGDTVKITCSNCSNVISDNLVKFDRILELPSANLDMSEWFCHGHGHGNCSQDTQSDGIIEPNKSDFLYRLTHFVVNNTVLSEKTNKFNSKRDVYHCNRCLAWLGLKNKGTVKLFNSEVKINNEGGEKEVFSHQNSTEDLHIDDFISTIETMTKEFNLGLQYTVMCKLVLECTISATNKQYLLIWVMDKELQVLKNMDNVIQNDKIILQSSFATKILFKVETSLNEEVEIWLANPGVITTDISKNMFCQGLEHLKMMSMKVPESFRTTNGYCVTYLKV